MDIKQVVKNIDSQIDTYTNELTHTPRVLVYHRTLNQEGFIIKDNANDPSGKSKENGFLVKWKTFGYTQWFPYKDLLDENENSVIELKREKPEVTVKVISFEFK